MMRRILRLFHLVAGLAAALVLLAMGVSGAVLVFENEIDHWLNANLKRVQPGGAPLPLDVLAAKMERAHPGLRLWSLMLADAGDIAWRATLKPVAAGRPLDVMVNPYTAEELGPLSRANTFCPKLHQFHKNLLLGEKGKLVTAWGSVLLVFLALSGLVLWWPRKLWVFRPRPGRRASFDLHNVAGFYSAVFMLIFGLTGAVIHWDTEAVRFVNRLAGAVPTPAPAKPKAHPSAGRPLGADEAAAIALQTVPGARVSSLMGLGIGDTINITMKFPEDHTPAGRTVLLLDSATGEVLSAQTSRTAPPGIRVVKLWNREIHTGDIFGWPTRLLACAASLALPLLAITGPLIWWERLRRERRRARETLNSRQAAG